MDFLNQPVSAHFNYWIYVILMMIGLFAMIAKNNLMKKLVGMVIFQTGIILFYVSIGVKEQATIPILGHHAMHAEHHANDEAHAPAVDAEHAEGHDGADHQAEVLPVIEARDYNNPLPHVLMLTAIVVGVSTLGLALAILQKVFAHYGTIEENEILAKFEPDGDC